MIKNFEQFEQVSEKCSACLAAKFAGTDDKRHIVLCGGTGCLSSNSAEILAEFEKQIKEKNLQDKVTVNQVGCFGFCSQGPFVKIYPEDPNSISTYSSQIIGSSSPFAGLITFIP